MANALTGGSPSDFAGLADSSLKTSTSQWRVVGMLQTTTTGDFTFSMANTTTVQPLGVCTTKLSANAADPITVRMFGITKATCNDTVTAGKFVIRSGEGLIAPLNAGLTGTGVSLTTHVNALGVALQTGVTNDVITIFVTPQLQERNF